MTDATHDASRTPPDAPVAPVPPADAPTLLVKIFGKDRPGITAGLFDMLAALRPWTWWTSSRW